MFIINNISSKLRHITRDFKAFLKDLLWYFVIIVTLPLTLPLVWLAIRKDDKEEHGKNNCK